MNWFSVFTPTKATPVVRHQLNPLDPSSLAQSTPLPSASPTPHLSAHHITQSHPGIASHPVHQSHPAIPSQAPSQNALETQTRQESHREPYQENYKRTYESIAESQFQAPSIISSSRSLFTPLKTFSKPASQSSAISGFSKIKISRNPVEYRGSIGAKTYLRPRSKSTWKSLQNKESPSVVGKRIKLSQEEDHLTRFQQLSKVIVEPPKPQIQSSAASAILESLDELPPVNVLTPFGSVRPLNNPYEFKGLSGVKDKRIVPSTPSTPFQKLPSRKSPENSFTRPAKEPSFVSTTFAATKEPSFVSTTFAATKEPSFVSTSFAPPKDSFTPFIPPQETFSFVPSNGPSKPEPNLFTLPKSVPLKTFTMPEAISKPRHGSPTFATPQSNGVAHMDVSPTSDMDVTMDITPQLSTDPHSVLDEVSKLPVSALSRIDFGSEKSVNVQSVLVSMGLDVTDIMISNPVVFHWDGLVSDVGSFETPDSVAKGVASSAFNWGAAGVKPSVSSGWTCDSCMVNNKDDSIKCISCETDKPGSVAKAPTPSTFNWGAAGVTPSASSGWTCDSCMVKNKNDSIKCISCETDKPGSVAKAPATTTFNWGAAGVKPSVSSGWTCDSCMVKNKDDSVKCISCETDKPGSVAKAPTPSTFNWGAAGVKPSASSGWTCNTCMVPNASSSIKCISCETPK